MMRALLIAGIMVGAMLGAADAQQRIDVYDKASRLQGYVIVDERLGRADFFDKYSCRTGYATFPPRRPGSPESAAPANPSQRPTRAIADERGRVSS